MGRYDQAPRITNRDKPANRDNFISMNWELFEAINEKIDSRHGTARSLMMLLVGSGDGFRLAQKTAIERLRIEKKAYYMARAYLQQLGLITYDPQENEIIVHYDKLMGSSQNSPSKTMGSLEDTPMSSSENPSKSSSENSHNIKRNIKEINNESFIF